MLKKCLGESFSLYPDSGANFNAKEDSDGKNVNGVYQVHLPDGRVQVSQTSKLRTTAFYSTSTYYAAVSPPLNPQTVTYTADHYNGYVADVKYDGYPQHPPQRPYKPSPPAYAPRPPHSFF